MILAVLSDCELIIHSNMIIVREFLLLTTKAVTKTLRNFLMHDENAAHVTCIENDSLKEKLILWRTNAANIKREISCCNHTRY